MVKIKKMFRSFKYAGNGFRIVIRENNFRFHLIVAFLVIIAMFVFGLSRLEQVALLFVIGMVLILESLNTIFEYLSDMLKPRLHDYIMIIKDIMASIVLLASILAILVGVIIFYPYVVIFFA